VHNYIYCANFNGASVTVLDGASNVWDTTVSVGMNPAALIPVPAMGRVYVANYGSSSISVLRDTNPSGVEESPKPRAASSKPLPTIVRGVLVLPASPCPRVPASPCLLDVSGRKVLNLHPGANDVRAVAPGVYFVREAQAQAVRKVVKLK
jgi:hypothetical protein